MQKSAANIVLALCVVFMCGLAAQTTEPLTLKYGAPLKAQRVWDWWRNIKAGHLQSVTVARDDAEKRHNRYRIGRVDPSIGTDVEDEHKFGSPTGLVKFKSQAIKREQTADAKAEYEQLEALCADIQADRKIKYPVIWRTDNRLSPWATNEVGNIGSFYKMLVDSTDTQGRVIVRPYEFVETEVNQGSHVIPSRSGGAVVIPRRSVHYIATRTDRMLIVLADVDATAYQPLVGQVVETSDAWELHPPSDSDRARGIEYEARPYSIQSWIDRSEKTDGKSPR
jgi:hypothetical protein